MKIKGLLLLFLLCLCLPAGAQPEYTITVNGMPANIPVREAQGKLWVELSSLAETLGLGLQADIPGKSLKLYQPEALSISSRTPLPGSPPPALWGQAALKEQDILMPLRHMRVWVFAPNAQISETLSYELLYSSVTQGTGDFTAEHGLITTGTTDLNGYYSFEKLPAGNLLLVAKYSYNSKAYVWRIPCAYNGEAVRLDFNDENQVK